MENGNDSSLAAEDPVHELPAKEDLVSPHNGNAAALDGEEKAAGRLSSVASEEDGISDAVDAQLRSKRKLKKRVSFVSEPSQEMRIISGKKRY